MRHYDYEKRRKVVTPVCFIVISLIIIDALLCQMLARAFAVMAWIKPPISLSSLPEIFCFVYVMAKGAFMLNFWGQNQRFQTWLEQNAVASMLIFEKKGVSKRGFRINSVSKTPIQNGVRSCLTFEAKNQRFQTWLEQNAVASMLIFE